MTDDNMMEEAMNKSRRDKVIYTVPDEMDDEELGRIVLNAKQMEREMILIGHELQQISLRQRTTNTLVAITTVVILVGLGWMLAVVMP